VTKEITIPLLPNLVVGFPHVITFYSSGMPEYNSDERETNFYVRCRMNPRTLDTRISEKHSMGCLIEFNDIVTAETNSLYKTDVEVENWLTFPALPIGYECHIDDSNKIYQFIQRHKTA
ncbi:MAG: hypothetical protein OQK82_05255, partial [Candidatus Pacearchaeota archaeon]|nr:hypothetical protein [Candidatus Pacearchaeota archaeon]